MGEASQPLRVPRKNRAGAPSPLSQHVPLSCPQVEKHLNQNLPTWFRYITFAIRQ